MPSASNFVSGDAVCARVKDADEQDSSIVPVQLTAGREFAASKWPAEPVVVFEEVVMARNIAGRLVFCRLLSECAQGKVRRIVVRDQDRLSRSDTVETLNCITYLQGHGVEVWQYRAGQQIRCDDRYAKMMATFVAGVATFEREIAAARTRDRMASMGRQGKWTGGYVPIDETKAKVQPRGRDAEPVSGKGFRLEGRGDGRSDSRPIWLPEMDSNHQPCD